MTIITYDELKAHAEKHFPLEFAKLPPVAVYSFFDTKKNLVDRTDEVASSGETPRKLFLQIGTTQLKYQSFSCPLFARYENNKTEILYPSSLKRDYSTQLREPFSWIEAGSGFDTMLEVLVRYCYLAAGQEGQLLFCKKSFAAFQKACVDISKRIGEKKTMLGVKDDDGEKRSANKNDPRDDHVRLFEDRFQRLAADFEAFKAGSTSGHSQYKTDKEEAEAKVKELEKKLETADGTRTDLELHLHEVRGELRNIKKEVEKAKKMAEDWKGRYETLQARMRRVMDGDTAL